MDYRALNADDKKALIHQRLRQLEADHFQHSLSRDLLADTGVDDEKTKEAIRSIEDSMATLSAGCAMLTRQLEALEKALIE